MNFEMPSESGIAICNTAVFIHRKRLMMRNSSGQWRQICILAAAFETETLIAAQTDLGVSR